MQRKREFLLILKRIICIITLSLLVTISMGGEFSEFVSFISFIQAVDPKNVSGIYQDIRFAQNNPCTKRWKGVKCNLEGTNIIAIRLENLGLSGEIDGKSLCNLDLHFLSLARNQIMGKIPNSISKCKSLRYLNLSSNLLTGNVPNGLINLKNLKILDISNNYFPRIFRLSKQEIVIPLHNDSMGPSAVQESFEGSHMNIEIAESLKKWKAWVPFVIGIVLVFVFIILVNVRSARLTKQKTVIMSLAKSPVLASREREIEEVNSEETRSKLVFFVEEKERFTIDDLLEAAADLRSQGLCSSLYKVQIKSEAVIAVKRLKKLKVSLKDFSETITWIGNLSHPNILPLVGFYCTNDNKFLIYRYQNNGSLLALQENHSQRKRRFPFKLRLSIAVGIARGLNFIYQSQHLKTEEELIPHGKIKPSNILLNENEEPLISEYGYSKFIDTGTLTPLNSKGNYTSPARSLSQEADVYSFGMILLELLTGKLVGRNGLDLRKWVKSMIRNEWTGEVFDMEVRRFEMFCFSLLNIALKCVAHFPENRPSIGMVLEKIEEVVSAFHDRSSSPSSSIEYST